MSLKLTPFLRQNLIAMNLQLTYDVSPRLALTGVVSNIFNTCTDAHGLTPFGTTRRNSLACEQAGTTNLG